MEAAFCRAERVTLAASMTPALNRSSYSPVAALRPWAALEVAHLLDDDPALEAGVDRDLLQRLLDGPGHDAGTGRLVAVELLGAFEDGGLGPQQGDPAAGDHALLDGGLGGRDGVLDAVLLLLELDLGGGADLDHGDAAGQLGQALLELLPVVVRVGVLDLGLDLVDPALDVGLGAAALDDGRLVLGDDDLAGRAQQVERRRSPA